MGKFDGMLLVSDFDNTLLYTEKALLEGRDMYGYEMIEALRARSNEVFRLKAGTLYPLLHSLEAQGWVTSSDGVANGRTRRYYAITRDGRAALAWLEQNPAEPQYILTEIGVGYRMKEQN